MIGQDLTTEYNYLLYKRYKKGKMKKSKYDRCSYILMLWGLNGGDSAANVKTDYLSYAEDFDEYDF